MKTDDEITDLQNKLVKLQALLQEKISLTKILEEKYQRLLQQFKLAQQYRFGSKSEKNINQLQIFDEVGIEPAPDEIEDDNATHVSAHKRSRGKRPQSLPKDLPREEIMVDVEAHEKICSCCNKERPKIGNEITEKLDIVPATLKVIRYVRPKYGNCCENESVVIAKLPRLFLPKCIATPALASHLIVSKYEQHLPLYRQEKIWQQHGVDFQRATMCRTILNSMDYCVPLLELLQQHIISYHYAQADETPVQVLNENGKRNTSKSYIWLYKGGPPDKPAFIFEYQPSRSGHCAQVFFENFRGHLQCDGYQGYGWIEQDPHKSRGGCFQHARRKFTDVIKIDHQDSLAQQAIKMIGELYGVEKIARENKLSFEERYILRQEKAVPIIEKLKIWLCDNVAKVPPRHKLGEAFTYVLNQWPHLITYLKNGEYEIDTNLIENQIRPFALGRKNWLFHGSPAGARAGAMAYTLIATAKANNLIPFEYLRYIFQNIRDCYSAHDFAKLLPFNLTAAQIKNP